MKGYRVSNKRQPPIFRDTLEPVNLPAVRCPVPREQAERRILIMRVGANGDITMGTPLLTALRKAYPTAYITWVVAPGQTQTIDAHPIVDDILVWDSLYWKQFLRWGVYPLWAFRSWQFGRFIRNMNYDAFISFQPEEWPLLTLAVNAKTSVGVFDTFMRYERSTRTSPRVKYYSHAFTHVDLPAHRTRQYLLPLRALGLSDDVDLKMTVGYTSADVAEVDEFLRASGARDGLPLVLIAPMTTWKTKCWPRDRYAALARRLLDDGYEVCVTGGLSDRAAIYDTAYMVERPVLTAAGIFGYRGLAALIDRASLVVCGDTGPMHTAAAMNTPYVSVFGPTSPEWFAPHCGVGEHLYHKADCGPCDQRFCGNASDEFQKCIRAVGLHEVYDACLRLLGRVSPGVARAYLPVAG